jgi:glutathione reductase (NADPH)
MANTPDERASMEYDYDLFVIGAGSGGVRGARMAAQTGARVAIAEEFRFGGTCVIRGCVPKKLLVYASEFSEIFKEAEGFGWSVGTPTFNWSKLIANKDAEIERLSGIYRGVLERNGVTIFQSRAVLEDAHTVRLLKEDRTVTAKTILVAVGSWPFVPPMPGSDLAITSSEAFDLPKLPGSIAIVGAGYIGLEFAGIFHGLGVDVTVVHRGPRLLRGFDIDMETGLAEAMTARGIKLMLNTKVAAIEKRDARFALVTNSGQHVEADLVMYATGRVPNTATLGLEKAGVVLGEAGQVKVDEFSRSSVDNIYAIGDVTDRVNLTPVAIDEAMRFVDTVFRGKPTPVDHHGIPTAVFSQPEIGTVGLTEEEARQKCVGVDIYKTSFRPLKAVLAGTTERTIMKIIVDQGSDQVVGVHILGPDAAEMAQILAIPLRLGATKADFDATMALHPTAAEELVTLREKWQPPAAVAAE